jgi:hypothetical protein
MKKSMKFAGLAIAAVLVCLTLASAVSAREIITVNKCNGGDYMIMAYNTATRTYYMLSGTLSSDSHRITVPNGYGSTINVTLGRAVGTRNLYESHDPLNPIFEVVKKSTYVIELVYKGRLSSSAAKGADGPLGVAGPPDDGKRMPPP